MGFFTPRERAELGESLDPKVPRRVREPIRRDFTPRRPARTHDPGTPDAATLAKLQKLSTTLDSQEVRQASAHIEAWAKKNC